MSIPDSPNTRKEMYLNAIAGGNGSIPSQPYTREEMYLDSIARNGSGGGGVGGGGGSGTNWLVVNAIYDSETDTYTLDKTAGEIYAACPFVIAVGTNEAGLHNLGLAYSWGLVDGQYSFNIGDTFTATSADEYPQSAGEM